MLNLHLQESKDKKYAIELNACAIKRKSQRHNDAQRSLMSCIAWRNKAIQQRECCYLKKK